MTVGELRAVLDWADDSAPVRIRKADGRWLTITGATTERATGVVIDTERDNGA